MKPTDQLLEVADKIKGWTSHMQRPGCASEGPSSYKMEWWAEQIEEAVAKMNKPLLLRIF